MTALSRGLRTFAAGLGVAALYVARKGPAGNAVVLGGAAIALLEGAQIVDLVAFKKDVDAKLTNVAMLILMKWPEANRPEDKKTPPPDAKPD